MASDPQPTGATPARQRLAARRDRASAYWLDLPGNTRGALWLLLSASLFTVMAVLTKFLGTRLDPMQVAFFRLFFATLVILPFLIRHGGFVPAHPRLMSLRGLVGGGAMLCMVYAFIELPLADAQAIQFAQALFLVPLAIVFLREVPGWRRITAVIVGFIGVLIMLRPTGAFDPAALVALFGALLVAGAAVLVKLVADKDSPLTMMLFSGVFGCAMAAYPMIAGWIDPTPYEWAMLAAIGLVGAGAHNSFLRAYRVGEATAIAPIDYVRLIFAGAAGFAFFGTVPDLYTVAGAVLIAATSLYIARREAAVARAKAAAAAAVRPEAGP